MNDGRPTDEPRLTSLSHGGGCGCKIAPGVLSEILRSSRGLPVPEALMVGIETADDAAVYRLNDQQALIATTDFFMPIVDDPHDFGRIAATNAISDVYAMGGTPIFHRHHQSGQGHPPEGAHTVIAFVLIVTLLITIVGPALATAYDRLTYDKPIVIRRLPTEEDL